MSAQARPGFTIEQDDTGGFVLRTAAGFRHPVQTAQHPVSDRWPDAGDGIQFSVTELVDTLTRLRAEDQAARPIRYDLDWEEGLDDRIRELYDEAS